MFKLFKKKETYWKVAFKDYKNEIKVVTIKAADKSKVYIEMKRIFFKAEIVDIIEA